MIISMKNGFAKILQKKKILIILGIISLLLIVIFLSQKINKENDKYSFTKDGVKYAIVVDGSKVNAIPAKGLYDVSVTCTNTEAKWLYDEWALYIGEITGDVSCHLTFTTVAKTYLNSYVIGLAGTTQGTGEVVNETATIDKSTFTAGSKLEQSGYTVSSNDATYPFEWDNTNKTWTSTNHTNSATATFIFNVATTGYYQFCYKQSSEQNYDYTIFYKDNTQIKSLKGISNSNFECYYLGNLTTSNAIKVTYQKDSSGSNGSDNVVFYLQSGTYNENIQTVTAGIRYEGKNPNNYVWFNNELWRIIGVFDSTTHGIANINLVKIIRAETLDGLAWHKSNTNDWTQASLNKLLNDNYYNRTDGTSSGNCYGYLTTVQGNCDYSQKGIMSKYRGMIQSVTWYLGGHSTTRATAETFYTAERGTTVYSGSPTSTTGYIGLMYPSDFGYSVLASSCARTINLDSYSSNTCGGASWLYGKGYEWTLAPYSGYSSSVFYVWDGGRVNNSDARVGLGVRPVLYLKSSTYKVSGEGTASSPYILGT